MTLTVCENCGVGIGPDEERLTYDDRDRPIYGIGGEINDIEGYEQVCEHFYAEDYEMAVCEVVEKAAIGTAYSALTAREQAVYDPIAYDETRVTYGFESEVPS